jgi:Asp-tRNA(Asn)/Glu-tRNA(Gln) amidotransferase A subunit family amidase
MSEARTQEDLAYLSATEQLRLFRSRELSPVDVLQAQIARAAEAESLLVARTDVAIKARRRTSVRSPE